MCLFVCWIKLCTVRLIVSAYTASVFICERNSNYCGRRYSLSSRQHPAAHRYFPLKSACIPVPRTQIPRFPLPRIESYQNSLFSVWSRLGPSRSGRRFKIGRQASAPSVRESRATGECYKRLYLHTSHTHTAV